MTRLKKLLQSGTKLNMPKLPDATQQKTKPKIKCPSLTLQELKTIKKKAGFLTECVTLQQSFRTS